MIDRLSSREDFEAIRARGVMRRSGPLSARVIPVSSPPSVMLVGFTIGRAFGGAVDRNRMRRRLRHCLRAVAADGDLDVSHALVGASRRALHASHDELMSSCRELVGARSCDTTPPSNPYPGRPRAG